MDVKILRFSDIVEIIFGTTQNASISFKALRQKFRAGRFVFCVTFLIVCFNTLKVFLKPETWPENGFELLRLQKSGNITFLAYFRLHEKMYSITR